MNELVDDTITEDQVKAVFHMMDFVKNNLQFREVWVRLEMDFRGDLILRVTVWHNDKPFNQRVMFSRRTLTNNAFALKHYVRKMNAAFVRAIRKKTIYSIIK